VSVYAFRILFVRTYVVYVTAVVSSSDYVTSNSGRVVTYQLESVCEEELAVLHIGSYPNVFTEGLNEIIKNLSGLLV
jgi:hypothetical protein